MGKVYTPGIYPFADQNGAKNPTRWGDGAAHTYIAYKKE